MCALVTGVQTVALPIFTGTNIRGAEPAGNEVLVIDAEEIQASGKATIGDFLRELPANFAGGVGMSDNIQGQDSSVAGSNMTGGQGVNLRGLGARSEENTSELQSLLRTSYAVFCLKKTKQ